jgi:hypothetical protein
MDIARAKYHEYSQDHGVISPEELSNFSSANTARKSKKPPYTKLNPVISERIFINQESAK